MDRYRRTQRHQRRSDIPYKQLCDQRNILEGFKSQIFVDNYTGADSGVARESSQGLDISGHEYVLE